MTKNNWKHGDSGTVLYGVWKNMLARCNNENHKSYAHYGGRGICVCAAWVQFVVFRDWALASGWCVGLLLDRKDVNGNYEPDNCQWVDHLSSNRNKRNNHFLTAFGETKTLSAWAEDVRAVVNVGNIARRLKEGMSPEDAITLVPRPRGGDHSSHPVTAFGVSQSVWQWTEDERCTVIAPTITKRLNAGWNAEAAISTPSRKRHR